MLDISLPELRVLAEKLGYKLVPIKKYVRFLPCSCGCNRRIHWSVVNNNEYGVILECKKCGFEVPGNSEDDAKHNWNKIVRDWKKKVQDGQK